jgi:NADH:ubiquinone oxidoreductase subunit 3 (subunit A)
MILLGPLGVTLGVFVAATAAALGLRFFGDALTRPNWTASERVPFTGGVAPDVHAWSRYHARYYSMALLFLSFDMEMAYMYPWAVVFIREGGIALAEMGVFITILLLGILYAWREGALRWS